MEMIGHCWTNCPYCQKAMIKWTPRKQTRYLPLSSMWRILYVVGIILLLALPGECQTAPIQFYVEENSPRGTVVGNINEASANFPPPYKYTNMDNIPFSGDSAGVITLQNAVDREVRSQYEFDVVSQRSRSKQFVIIITDVNDNSPQFVLRQDVHSLDLFETANVAYKTPLGSVVDPDLGVNSTVECEIVSGNTDSTFRLEVNRQQENVYLLDLVVNNKLDYEETPNFALVLTAYDHGSPPKSSVTQINITILDENDNAPAFALSYYAAQVPEDASIGQVVMRVTATDIDSGANGVITYDIDYSLSDFSDDTFQINATSGVIYINKHLDYETKHSYKLVVMARDGGVQSQVGMAVVTVNVTDVNDNAPGIDLLFLITMADQDVGLVQENTAAEGYLARISVTDADISSPNISVSLEGGDHYFGLTTEDNVVYLVELEHNIDREATPFFNMTITATDSGQPPLSTHKTFSILVADLNDNAPVFERSTYYANIQETISPSASILQVTAVDSDLNSNSQLVYSIVEPQANSWLQIDSTTGVISTRSTVDCQQRADWTFTVLAEDRGQPSLSGAATVNIAIRYVNDNPPSFHQTLYNVSVSENTTVGSCVLTVSASDPDCGDDAVFYSIPNNQGFLVPTEFTLSASAGSLCLEQALDYEVTGLYEFNVMVADRPQALADPATHDTALVRVHVLDVNDNRPVFRQTDYRFTIADSRRAPAVLGHVEATDRDSGFYGRVTYTMTSGQHASLFSVHSITGAVSVVRPLPLDTPQYSLRVQAEDGGGLTGTSQLTVTVTSGTQPAFSSVVYDFTVAEDAPLRALVGTVYATTQTGSVQYEVVDGDPDNLFSLDTTTGLLRILRALDHEVTPTVTLSVQARAGSQYTQTQVRINITDINDNAPIFVGTTSRISISIKEDTPVNSEIYWAKARDIDSGENSRLSYTLEDPSGRFTITSTGRILLAGGVNRERSEQHDVTVIATDHGKPPQSSTLLIAILVLDVNDNSPVFDQREYSFEVSEQVDPNTNFAQVHATDEDSGNNGKITFILQGLADVDTFGLFPDTGYLYTRKPLDRETQTDYVLEVVAVDNGFPANSATVAVQIHVGDTNDNNPVFLNTPYEFFVEENQPPGRIGLITAADPDATSQLRYQLSGSVSGLAVSPEGELSTTRQLDREGREVYTVTVMVSDRGTPPRSSSARVTITVLDLNDNSPVFTGKSHYTARVREQLPKGTIVTTVTATDRDSGPNGNVTYSLFKDLHNLDWQIFQIHPTNGRITTNNILDHESKQQFAFKVVAKDSGTSARSSMATVEIYVDDENENPPIFSNSLERFQVIENTAPGTIIGSVKAHDADSGPNVKVFYYIITGNLHSTFGVNRTTGEIHITRPVDYEDISEYAMQIMAIDNDPHQPLSSVVSVNVSIVDINDNAPVFDGSPVVVSVEENVEVGTHITTVTARDADSGPRGALLYTLEPDSLHSNMVRIDAQTGFLYTTQPLDYEELTQISVIVKAQDQPTDGAPLFSTTSIRILIQDKNDNPPVFQSRTQVIIFEDEPLHYPVLHVIATDADSNENGNVSYSLLSGNEDNHFYLDSYSGLLSVIQTLDRERWPAYSLRVAAQDNGHPGHTTTATITVDIMDVNDNAPVFERSVYKVDITENNAPDQPLVRIQATDQDMGENAELTYIIPDGTLNNLFKIDSTSGQISCAAVLDRESQSSWLLTAYVRDGAYPALYDTATVLVTVLDTNDHSPAFHELAHHLHVPENAHIAIIHTVKATDPDEGLNGHITYHITSGNIGDKFVMDKETGALSCAALDRETQATYNLTISARDNGSPRRLASTTHVSVTVGDVNDNDPVFMQVQYAASITEDTPKGTSVLTVSAKDADEGINAVVAYSINNSAQGLFKINNVTGVITTSGEFDREKETRYTFEVYAIDGGLYGPRSRTVRVQITITDVNDNAPIFQEVPYKAEIDQNFAINNIVTTVSAYDRDAGANGTVMYALAKPSIYFKVDNSTGEVRTQRWLTDATAEIHVLDIVAYDLGTPARQAVGYVEIKVGNVLSPSSLRFTNLSYQVSLVEHASYGSEVMRVRAQLTNGSNTQVTYSFASGNENDAFLINQETGVITVNDPDQLDYETTVNHRLRLIVLANSRSADGYTAVWINLKDANDNDPVFTQDRYTSSVYEGNPRDTFVTQIIATDEDAGINGQIDYVIVSGNTDNAFIINPPNTGIIKTRQVLDREIVSSYKLTVEARDGGSPPRSSTATVRIQVVDENDNAPFFPTYAARQLSEGAELGTEVVKLTANDGDLTPALTYSFTAEGNPGGVFSIDRYSGRIALDSKLDYEEDRKYTLSVMASDTKHNVTTQVVINVLDDNDNEPEFSQSSYEVTLNEQTGPGLPVLTVNASDADSGDNARITYSMLPHDGFYINQHSGTIFTNKTLEYSSVQPTHLVVTARDHGAPALSAIVPVQVRVQDINNNAPVFVPFNDEMLIPEDENKGFRVIKITAFDSDHMPDNSKVDYSLTDGNDEAMFDIDSSSGQVLLVGALDHERTDLYELTVLAQDRGQPPLSSSTTLTIRVKDVNDNAPRFSAAEYTAAVTEDAPIHSTVIQVAAFDMDSGLNGRVEYSIYSGNDHNNFDMDRDTGLLTVKTPLDHEMAAMQLLSIQAMDSSSEYIRQSVLCSVLINITDVNEFHPDFPLILYLKDVMELKPAGTFVFQAQAYDKDRGKYGVLTYSISNDQDNFMIDPGTGDIKTKKVLNYTSQNEYRFTVVAADSGGLQAYIQTVVNVLPHVIPYFSMESYNFQVAGNAKKGDTIGQIHAYDKNGNPSNLIRYSLKNENMYISINSTSGVLYVIKDLISDGDEQPPVESVSGRERRSLSNDNLTVVVLARAGHTLLSPAAEVSVLVVVDRTCAGCQAPLPNKGGLGTTAVALIVAFVLVGVVLGIVILVMCLRGRDRKNSLANQSHYDSSSFETLDVPPPPMRGGFAPPPYNEASGYPHLHHHHHNMTTSEMSDRSRSASSGRGSAEHEDVDDEIRMINATQSQTQGMRIPDSGIQQDDDAMSEHSVQNHTQYLAKLGIDTSKFKLHNNPTANVKSGVGSSVESMHHFSDEGGGEGDGLDIGNLVYSKLGEMNANEDLVAMDGTHKFGEHDKASSASFESVINSDDEFAGSYNWDYLLDWGPQYQPLAHVFAEIARLKDDTIKPKTKPTHIVPQYNSALGNLPHPRMNGPPPMITDTPPKSVPMGDPGVLKSKSSHSHSSLHSANSARTSQLTSVSLPKSPLSYESSFTSAPMSPSFTPSLSPLATRSPSISPLDTPQDLSRSHSTNQHQDAAQGTMSHPSSCSEQEIHI